MMDKDFQVIEHYIRTAHKEPQAIMSEASQEELWRALESLSERLDAMDRVIHSLADQHI